MIIRRFQYTLLLVGNLLNFSFQGKNRVIFKPLNRNIVPRIIISGTTINIAVNINHDEAEFGINIIKVLRIKIH